MQVVYISFTHLHTATWQSFAPHLEPDSESHPPLHLPDIQITRFEIHPRTCGPHCFSTPVLPCSLLWGRCQQQHSRGSYPQRLCAWLQMAHPVGICQTAAVCAHWCCCGKLQLVHLKLIAMMQTAISNCKCIFSFQLAFGAAILNIQIPLMLGDLVNVVARYLREHSGTYVNEIKGPAMKLLGLYAIQVRTKHL